MSAVTPMMSDIVKVDRTHHRGGILYTSHRAASCTMYEVPACAAGGAATVWLEDAAADSLVSLAVLSRPGHSPVLYQLTRDAVDMLKRRSARTVVTWMCRAAGIQS